MLKNNAQRETTILIFHKIANGADHHLITTIIKYGTVYALLLTATTCLHSHCHTVLTLPARMSLG